MQVGEFRVDTYNTPVRVLYIHIKSHTYVHVCMHNNFAAATFYIYIIS